MHKMKVVYYSPENATEDDLIQFYKENKEKYEGMILCLGEEDNYVEYSIPYTEQELIDNITRLIGYYLEDLENNIFFDKEKLGNLSPSTFDDAMSLYDKLRTLYSAFTVWEDLYKMEIELHPNKKKEITDAYERRVEHKFKNAFSGSNPYE